MSSPKGRGGSNPLFSASWRDGLYLNLTPLGNAWIKSTKIRTFGLSKTFYVLRKKGNYVATGLVNLSNGRKLPYMVE